MFSQSMRDQLQPPPGQEEVPWLFSTLARGVSTIAGLLSIFFGIWAMIGFDFSCLLAGILLICEGIAVTLIESPCLCVFLDFAHLPSRFYEGKPHWWKASTYALFSVIPFFICQNFSTILSCCLLAAASATYLILSLGKKASVEEMRTKAMSENPSAILVNNEAAIDKSGPAQFTPSVALGDMRNNQPTIVTY
ncbi:calcium channel flower-like [Panonychus citri]|uniref:calcium channel flower-like n=1 Tax=Panonychus citri TaxID=50023 RepID=UPI002307FDC5|nr:calcium channel flower-like [Panonychus citri]